MYSILIIDDEIQVTKNLADHIDWDGLGIEEVFTANSAQEALNMIDDNKIDLVLSDILMPNMTGLQLAETLSHKIKHYRIIFLSGYSDFDYAKKAIDVGAFAYLNKPAPYAEIEDTVRAALENLKTEMKLTHDYDTLLKSYRKALPFIIEMQVLEWLQENNHNAIQQLIDLNCLQFSFLEKHELFLVCVCFVDKTSHADAVKIKQHVIEIKESIIDFFHFSSDSLVFSDSEDTIYCISHDSDHERLALQHRKTRQLSDNFEVVVQTTFLQDIRTYVSGIVKAPDAPKTFENMRMATRNTDLMQETIMIANLNEGSGTDLDNQIVAVLRRYPGYTQMLAATQLELLVLRIHELFRKIGDHPKKSHTLLTRIYFYVVHSILDTCSKLSLSSATWLYPHEDVFLDYARHVKSIQALEIFVMHYTRSICEYMKNNYAHYSNNIIGLTRYHIEQDLGQNLSIRELAERVSVHPNYLSTLFKKNTGMTIHEYTCQIKMKEAKRLLSQIEHNINEYHICEIAQRLGYENTTSFNRVFRKMTNKSPREYRNNLSSSSSRG
jgi:two-component system response regulator YesN